MHHQYDNFKGRTYFCPCKHAGLRMKLSGPKCEPCPKTLSWKSLSARAWKFCWDRTLERVMKEQAPVMLYLLSHPFLITTRTRRSENDNTPQPLDQWTNSPFIGQQVGNSKSFTLTHYLADLFAMHHGPSSIPLCIHHHIPSIPSELTLPFLSYSNFNILPWKSKVKVMGEVKVWSHNVSLKFYRFTSLSFHVNRPSHSWDTTFSKFDLENSKSRSWKRCSLKVTTWVQHSIDSHPFRSMSIGHPIHKIQFFQNLTLKIQGQGHGWGECWTSQHGSNILSTHIPFIPCHSAIPFLIRLFQNMTLKIQGPGHGSGQNWKSQSGCNILSTHVPFVPCQSASHSWDTPFSKFDLENPRSRSWVRGTLKVSTWVQYSIDSHHSLSVSLGNVCGIQRVVTLWPPHLAPGNCVAWAGCPVDAGMENLPSLSLSCCHISGAGWGLAPGAHLVQ